MWTGMLSIVTFEAFLCRPPTSHNLPKSMSMQHYPSHLVGDSFVLQNSIKREQFLYSHLFVSIIIEFHLSLNKPFLPVRMQFLTTLTDLYRNNRSVSKSKCSGCRQITDRSHYSQKIKKMFPNVSDGGGRYNSSNFSLRHFWQGIFISYSQMYE